ncbi:hypothetical protein BO66DRAFT_313793, partial [Aspergillus aculeatinus CBS 121060]
AHTTTGCGKQGFPSAQPYLSHTPGANPFCCMFFASPQSYCSSYPPCLRSMTAENHNIAHAHFLCQANNARSNGVTAVVRTPGPRRSTSHQKLPKGHQALDSQLCFPVELRKQGQEKAKQPEP